MKNIVIILIIAFSVVISYFANAGLVWAVCWGFGWTWSWKIATAVWAVEWLLSLTFKSRGKR